MKPNKIVEICWYLVIISIGIGYIARSIFLLEISLFFGLSFLRNIQIKTKDIYNIFGMVMVLLGVVISRLFYTPDISYFVNVSFIIKTYAFFIFLYIYITRYGFPFNSLYIIAFFSLPHAFAYFFGFNVFSGWQFSGLYSDPNYLSPDLLSSLSSSLILVNSNISRSKKLLFLFAFFVSIILIILTASRTAISASVLIFLSIFILKLYSKISKFYVFSILFATIFLVFGNFLDNLFDIPHVKFIIDRFFYTSKGGDLYENERYFLWEKAYELIQDTGLFEGYNPDTFIQVYGKTVHHAWLNLGLRMGSYTFWMHSLIFAVGLILWTYKHANMLRLKQINAFGGESFLLIFCISISFMIFSISVEYMYYYWFMLFIIYMKGFLSYPNVNLPNK